MVTLRRDFELPLSSSVSLLGHEMNPGRVITGPMDGHWMQELKMIEPEDEGKAFICLVCIRDKGVDRSNAKFRSANNASNLYSHFKHVHSAMFSVLELLIQARVNNKRRCTEKSRQGTIGQAFVRSNQKSFDQALLSFFSAPDVPNAVISSNRFKKVISAANSSLSVPTVKTLNSRLWTKFNSVIEDIKLHVAKAEFVVLLFDGWSTVRNQSVLGCMVASLDSSISLVVKTVGNFHMTRGHTAQYLCDVLKQVVQKRLGGRTPTFFLSDSASVNKAAVKLLMGVNEGDDYWFPCSVHFCQLAMKEAVTHFLTAEEIGDNSDNVDWGALDDDAMIEHIDLLSSSNAYERLTCTLRAVRAALRRSHNRMQAFTSIQDALAVHKMIVSDVRTRFDSTLDMFESVLLNKPVLVRLQERGRREPALWPPALHLSADDFELMHHVVQVLEPIRDATKQLSAASSTLSDVIPTFTSTLEAVRDNAVPSSASVLKQSLVEALVLRLGMLLDTEEQLPSMGGPKFTRIAPNEFVVASYLNPRYAIAMRSCYGYEDRMLVNELKRIYEDHIGGLNIDPDQEEDEDVKVNTNADIEEEKATLQSWVDRFAAGGSSNRSRRPSRQHLIRHEFAEYLSDISGKSFTVAESRQFWIQARESKKHPRVCCLARLFWTIPSSAIPQERHFSELKRRCGALRTGTKVETLDRDAVVYAWLDDVSGSSS